MKQWQTKNTAVLFIFGFGTRAIIVTQGLEMEQDETEFSDFGLQLQKYTNSKSQSSSQNSGQRYGREKKLKSSSVLLCLFYFILNRQTSSIGMASKTAPCSSDKRID